MRNTVRSWVWGLSVIGVSFGLGNGAMAFDHKETENQIGLQDMFQEVYSILERCAVQPYSFDQDGNRIDHTIQSECEILKIELHPERQGVVIEFDRGSKLTAELVDTDFSDGGDFGRLTLTPSDGSFKVVVGQVLAFRDPVKAILSLMNPAPVLRQKETE